MWNAKQKQKMLTLSKNSINQNLNLKGECCTYIISNSTFQCVKHKQYIEKQLKMQTNHQIISKQSITVS